MDYQGGVCGDEFAGIGVGDMEGQWDGIVAVSRSFVHSILFLSVFPGIIRR